MDLALDFQFLLGVVSTVSAVDMATCFKSGGLAFLKTGILCLECLLWNSVSQQLTAFIYESCNELTIILLILAVYQ